MNLCKLSQQIDQAQYDLEELLDGNAAPFVGDGNRTVNLVQFLEAVQNIAELVKSHAEKSITAMTDSELQKFAEYLVGCGTQEEHNGDC